MKNKFLLAILSTFLLSSCDLGLADFNILSNKTNGLNQQSQNQENFENSSGNPGENENITPENEGENNQSQNQNNGEHEQEKKTKIYLSGAEFSTVASDAGIQMDDTTYPNNAKNLKDYFISKLPEEDYLTKLECTKLNTTKWNNKVYLCVGTGYYANGKYVSGNFKWTSSYKIYKIEIDALAYKKDGSQTDPLSHIWINSEDFSLEQESSVDPETKSFSFDFDEGINSFQIKSTGSRVLLESITITWTLEDGTNR